MVVMLMVMMVVMAVALMTLLERTVQLLRVARNPVGL